MMLNTFADGSLTDKTSATSVAAQRRAAHDVLYMVVNSNAMNGLSSGVKITYSLATWQKALIAGDVAAAAVVVLGIVMILRKKEMKANG